MYGRCTRRQVACRPPKHSYSASTRCIPPVQQCGAHLAIEAKRSRYTCVSNDHSQNYASRDSDDNSCRIQWPRRFLPRTPTGVAAPDVSNQPHQPMLSRRTEPLRKVLAAAGIDSYRKCRSIVLGGHVTVDGVTERHPQRLVDPERERILVKGRALELARVHTFLLLHKPVGMLCSMIPEASASVMSLADMAQPAVNGFSHYKASMHMIWRLGAQSSGMQLVTTDSDWASQVMASAHVEQDFLVTLATIPSTAQVASMRRGGGQSAAAPRRVTPVQVHRTRKQSRWRITVVARRCADVHALVLHAGLRCLHVKRIRIGGLILPAGVLPGKGYALQSLQIQHVLDLDACRSAVLNCTFPSITHAAPVRGLTLRVSRGRRRCQKQVLPPVHIQGESSDG
eukprot:jgi/Ulvmu1/5111/UM021_0128.1